MTNPQDLQFFVSSQMEELFLEWLELPNTQKLIRRVLNLARGGQSVTKSSSPTLSSVSSRGSSVSLSLSLDDEVAAAPLPFFTSLSGGNPGSPPHSPRGMTSPTNSTGSRSNIPIPRASPDLSASIVSPPRSPSLPADVMSDDGFVLPKAAAIGTPTSRQPAPIVPVSPLVPKADASGIPAFYFPPKRQHDGGLDPSEIEAIDKLFGPKNDRLIESADDLKDFTTNVLGLSRYFAEPLFKRIQRLAKDPTAISRQDVVNFWSGRLSVSDPTVNFFQVVKQEQNPFLTRSDFREFLWVLLDSHPGLAFLRDSPEFQERYADTVICRIFYHTDRRRTNKITLRDLRRSTNPSIIKSWLDLDLTDDINSVRNFFSYEHFYVLYCKFWDLDGDHDFLIDKDDLQKYDGHAWSPRAIDRVFQQVGMKFTSGVPNKMGYDDFVWFLLSDEDKTSEQAMEFLFSIVDLDGDGVIRDHEMRHFYEEQVHRLECVNQEAPKLEDIICQMNDLIGPRRDGQFRLDEFFKRRKNNAGVFFSILLSLNKFMQYEQRDPFQLKQDQLNNPELTDWDRFCLGEYVRLAIEANGSNNASSANGSTAAGDHSDEFFLRNADVNARRSI